MGFKYASFEPFHNHLIARRLRFRGTDWSLKRGYFCLKTKSFLGIFAIRLLEFYLE